MIITEPLWDALYHWYGGGPIISRRVIKAYNKKLELELYPLLLHICVCNKNGIPEPCDQLLSSKVQTVELREEANLPDPGLRRSSLATVGSGQRLRRRIAAEERAADTGGAGAVRGADDSDRGNERKWQVHLPRERRETVASHPAKCRDWSGWRTWETRAT